MKFINIILVPAMIFFISCSSDNKNSNQIEQDFPQTEFNVDFKNSDIFRKSIKPSKEEMNAVINYIKKIDNRVKIEFKSRLSGSFTGIGKNEILIGIFANNPRENSPAHKMGSFNLLLLDSTGVQIIDKEEGPERMWSIPWSDKIDRIMVEDTQEGQGNFEANIKLCKIEELKLKCLKNIGIVYSSENYDETEFATSVQLLKFKNSYEIKSEYYKKTNQSQWIKFDGKGSRLMDHL